MPSRPDLGDLGAFAVCIGVTVAIWALILGSIPDPPPRPPRTLYESIMAHGGCEQYRRDMVALDAEMDHLDHDLYPGQWRDEAPVRLAQRRLDAAKTDAECRDIKTIQEGTPRP